MIECMLLQQTRVIVIVSQGWLFFVSYVAYFQSDTHTCQMNAVFILQLTYINVGGILDA